MALTKTLVGLGMLASLLAACAKSQVEIYPERPLTANPPVRTSPSESPGTAKPSPSTQALPPLKSYAETIAQWKSYLDLVRWMEKDFSFDAERFKKFKGTLPPPRTPEETFRVKSGIYFDAALFAKDALNRINPSYRAKVGVVISQPYGANHYFCSFQNGSSIFIMDYGNPSTEMTGTHGPYASLEEVKKMYEKFYSGKARIEGIAYLP